MPKPMKDLHKFNKSRRKFIGQASCLALGYSSLFNTLVNLKALNFAASGSPSTMSGGDYKALVCFFKSGGADSFNMLAPRTPSAYNEYATTRSNLAIPRDELLPINPVNSPGLDLGLHPNMGGIQQLFNNGQLSFISNIGTLIEPTNKIDIRNSDANLPLGLFSHSDQIQQWQTAYPHERSNIGWGGRIADIIKSVNDNQNVSMNVSLSGTNIFQIGNDTIEYSLDPYNGAVGITGYGEHAPWNVFDIQRTEAIDKFLDHHYADAFKQTFVDVSASARDAFELVDGAMETLSEFNTQFSDTYLSQSMRMIARMIAIQQQLGMKRQIFFVDFGGWDHHDELLNNQASMLNIVDSAMVEFHQVLQELNMLDCVTTFSVSEFGRTLTSNGNGTDHAWGGNVMVMGGNQVNGGRIFGQYPSLALNNSLEIGNGVLIPTTSADTYFAEPAMWFGVQSSELATIFPNLSNFYSIGSGQAPIGFLNL